MFKSILVGAVVFAIGLSNITSSFAFFATNDKTEAYTILPSETAFWIPDVGDNKNSQAKLDSESYFEANRLAVKRFVIPHQKLSGTGGTAWFSGPDSYVPTGRLIIVDRTPQSREWVKDEKKGTSTMDESFPCQTVEGLNIRIGVSLGVSVTEENAAKYLYNFGVLPPYVYQDGKRYLADRTDPATIFTSVYYGRSLADVTDDVVRKKIQTLVCNEVAGLSFDAANQSSVVIMQHVQDSATKYLANYGITLNFIGYADTWEFDADIQKAVNDKYAATSLKGSLDTLQTLNNIHVQEGLADGLRNHGLPIVIPENLLNSIVGLAKHINTN